MTTNKQKLTKIINDFTADEDTRQDLWVFYLTGTKLAALPFVLRQLQNNLKYQSAIELSEHHLLQAPLSPRLQNIVDQFSDFEKKILYYLILGLNEDDIAEYRNISRIRIRQAISTICNSVRWKDYLNGTKEKINRP